ncbi:flagellar hook-length control protein FliK [Palleronia abyssalis]|uniref:Flagellar hook-length control protein-like C-terminal domain-containing protein n=1 Tax=Palleronia abyssalis TaxID=1501240 RepID=A0A2R8BWT8_9RHOB|nr:flagellar hook-length control protein FliK [Palleronia abyssalis]SPJ24624.1 hypothetical protein PAA8504_02461 [Palleronia abyssalis]
MTQINAPQTILAPKPNRPAAGTLPKEGQGSGWEDALEKAEERGKTDTWDAVDTEALPPRDTKRPGRADAPDDHGLQGTDDGSEDTEILLGIAEEPGGDPDEPPLPRTQNLAYGDSGFAGAEPPLGNATAPEGSVKELSIDSSASTSAGPSENGPAALGTVIVDAAGTPSDKGGKTDPNPGVPTSDGEETVGTDLLKQRHSLDASPKSASDLTSHSSPTSRKETGHEIGTELAQRSSVTAEPAQPKANTQPAIAPQIFWMDRPKLSPIAQLSLEGSSSVKLSNSSSPELIQASSHNPVLNSVSHSTPAEARPVAQSLASAIVRSDGNTCEVALSPEELGKVRITMSSSDAGMIVRLFADRDDTMQLLRRHAADLAAELKNAGIADAQIDFGDSGANKRQQQSFTRQPAILGTVQLAAETPPLPATIGQPQADGLDLRF